MQKKKRYQLPFKTLTVACQKGKYTLDRKIFPLSTDNLSDKGHSLNDISCEKPLSASVL